MDITKIIENIKKFIKVSVEKVKALSLKVKDFVVKAIKTIKGDK